MNSYNKSGNLEIYVPLWDCTLGISCLLSYFETSVGSLNTQYDKTYPQAKHKQKFHDFMFWICIHFVSPIHRHTQKQTLAIINMGFALPSSPTQVHWLRKFPLSRCLFFFNYYFCIMLMPEPEQGLACSFIPSQPDAILLECDGLRLKKYKVQFCCQGPTW